MALVVPNVGEVRLLRYIVNNVSPTNLVLHLYVNDVTPSELDSTSTFTEATSSGYSSATLSGSSWSVGTTDGTSSALYSAGITFTFSVGESVYGYYVTDTPTGNLLWAERFPGAPFALPSGGGEIAVRPQVQLS